MHPTIAWLHHGVVLEHDNHSTDHVIMMYEVIIITKVTVRIDGPQTRKDNNPIYDEK
jgi:hypothetical protein